MNSSTSHRADLCKLTRWNKDRNHCLTTNHHHQTTHHETICVRALQRQGRKEWKAPRALLSRRRKAEHAFFYPQSTGLIEHPFDTARLTIVTRKLEPECEIFTKVRCTPFDAGRGQRGASHPATADALLRRATSSLAHTRRPSSVRTHGNSPSPIPRFHRCSAIIPGVPCRLAREMASSTFRRR